SGEWRGDIAKRTRDYVADCHPYIFLVRPFVFHKQKVAVTILDKRCVDYIKASVKKKLCLAECAEVACSSKIHPVVESFVAASVRFRKSALYGRRPVNEEVPSFIAKYLGCPTIQRLRFMLHDWKELLRRPGHQVMTKCITNTFP